MNHRNGCRAARGCCFGFRRPANAAHRAFRIDTSALSAAQCPRAISTGAAVAIVAGIGNSGRVAVRAGCPGVRIACRCGADLAACFGDGFGDMHRAAADKSAATGASAKFCQGHFNRHDYIHSSVPRHCCCVRPTGRTTNAFSQLNQAIAAGGEQSR